MGYNYNGQLGDGTFTTNFPFGTDRPELLTSLTKLAGISLIETNLVLNGLFGVAGTTNYVLMSTNIALPLNQWIRVETNVLNVNGNFSLTLTNAVNLNVPQSFYLLQTQ